LLQAIFAFLEAAESSRSKKTSYLPGAEVGVLQTDLPILSTALLFYLALLVV